MTLTGIGTQQWIERGERIEQARNWIHLTQGQLGEAMSELLGYGISRQIVYVLEQGERDWRGDEIAALTHVLQQSRAWLDGEPDAVFNPGATSAMGRYISSRTVLGAAA
jgi:predicted HD phosphohydrolase